MSEHEGTTLEGIVQGCLDKFSDEEIDLLTKMTVAAQRPINWNVLTVDAAAPDRVPRQLAASGLRLPPAAGSWPSPCRCSSR